MTPKDTGSIKLCQNPLGHGLGLGLRSEYFDHLKHGHPAFQWLEIITENFIDSTSQTLEDLDKLRSHYDLTLHGVSLSIGGQHPIDEHYLAKIKKLAKRLNPAIISDHLSFSRHLNQNSHDLLPIAYTEDSLVYVSERIQFIQDFLGQRFFLENPSAYLSYKLNEIPEQEFMAHLCKHTGCGMILDVNNLFVNQCNLGLQPLPYLEALSPKYIGYIHMAGHLDQPGVKIDTHGTTIASEVWDLYQVVVQKFGAIPSMIERDQNIPDFNEILEESQHLGKLLNQATFAPKASLSTTPTHNRPAYLLGTKAPPQLPLKRDFAPWQECTANFFAALTEKSDKGWAAFAPYLRPDIPTQPANGFSVYKQGYPLRLLDTLKGQMPAFSKVVGEKTLKNLLWAYIDQHPPTSYCVDRSLFDFSKFLGDHDNSKTFAPFFAEYSLNIKAFVDLATWEQSVYQIKTIDSVPNRLTTEDFLTSLENKTLDELLEVQLKLQPSTGILAFDYDIIASWMSYQKNRPIDLPKQKPTYAIVSFIDGKLKTQRLPRWQYRFLTKILQGRTLGESLLDCGIPDKSMLQKGLSALGYWTEKSLFTSIHWPTVAPLLSKKEEQTSRCSELPFSELPQTGHQISGSP